MLKLGASFIGLVSGHIIGECSRSALLLEQPRRKTRSRGLRALGLLALLGSQLLAALCDIKQVFAQRRRVKRPCERPYDAGLFSESFNPVHWGLFVSEYTPLTQKRMLHARKAARHLGKRRSYSDANSMHANATASHAMSWSSMEKTITAAQWNAAPSSFTNRSHSHEYGMLPLHSLRNVGCASGRVVNLD